VQHIIGAHTIDTGGIHMAARRAANFGELLLVEKNLQALTHTDEYSLLMAVVNSICGVERRP